MFYTECGKLLIKQKLILFLLLFFLLKIIITLYSGYDSEVRIERNPEGYMKYIEQYQGKLTEEKSNRIDEENAKVNISYKKTDDLQFKKSKGQISDEEFKKEMIAYQERQKNFRVFQVFYSKYFYAKENPSERYIMDDRGWNTILCNNNPDYLLIFCLMIVLTPIFCHEYECDMHSLILSTTRGKHQLSTIKIINGCFFAAMIILIFSIIECLVMNYMVGLDNFLYPVQSLGGFKDCVYEMSIIEAYIYFVVFRLIGAFLLFGFISVCSVVLKKTNTTLFFTMLIAISPFVIVENRLNLFYIPLPSGLFLGNKFLSNIQDLIRLADIYLQNRVISYDLILILILIINGVIAVTLLAVSKRLYSNGALNLGMHLKKIKRSSALFILIPFLCLLMGCDTYDGEETPLNVCIEESSRYGETEQYKINFDITKNELIAEDKTTKKTINLLRDVIYIDAKVDGIFVRDEWCYYLETQKDKAGFRIYGVDLNNFNEKLIYNNLSENVEDFFGLVVKDSEEDLLKTMEDYIGFYLDDNYIYYLDYSDNLIQIDRRTKNEKVIAIDVYSGFNTYFYNNDIYYSDTQARLCRFESKSGSVQYIDDIYTDDFKIEDNKLIYKDLLDEDNVKSIDLASKE